MSSNDMVVRWCQKKKRKKNKYIFLFHKKTGLYIIHAERFTILTHPNPLRWWRAPRRTNNKNLFQRGIWQVDECIHDWYPCVLNIQTHVKNFLFTTLYVSFKNTIKLINVYCKILLNWSRKTINLSSLNMPISNFSYSTL